MIMTTHSPTFPPRVPEDRRRRGRRPRARRRAARRAARPRRAAADRRCRTPGCRSAATTRITILSRALRDGPGRLHRAAHAGGRGARGRPRRRSRSRSRRAGEAYINAHARAARSPAARPRCAEGYDKLRIAGAQARTMLVAAAAQKWGVDAVGLPRAERRGAGPGRPEGHLRRAGRGRRPSCRVPKDVKLKDHKASRYVGKPRQPPRLRRPRSTAPPSSAST